MEIRGDVENLVRRAMAGAIAGQQQPVQDCVTALHESGLLPEALNMFFYASGAVVNGIHPDGWDDEDLRELAGAVIEAADGLDLFTSGKEQDISDVAYILEASALGEYDESALNAADFAGMLPVVSGLLVGISATEAKKWWEQLDIIWEAFLSWEPEGEEIDFVRAWRSSPPTRE